MSATSPRSVRKEIVSILTENIEDPVTPRSNKDERWVFDHFPKPQTLPRVGIHKIDKTFERQSIGRNQHSDIVTHQATIMARRNKSYEFGSNTQPKPAEDLVDYLEQEVKTAILENQGRFRNLGCVRYVLPQQANFISNPDNNWIGSALTVETTIDPE